MLDEDRSLVFFGRRIYTSTTLELRYEGWSVDIVGMLVVEGR